MLQIKDIKKEYNTGSLVQRALDGVSLNLRDNEFVAILGPSGSGKTTLLNIIGGLDRYDSGELIINGVATGEYTDRDWDSYRNHTIGFVFQNYNLIPHQSVLANVELALTISGITSAERKEKALKALTEVGLADHVHKRPNQLSGGQMQRVAIARALVNDPDILLADEPTGALDSETSVQVMDLLKEVAKDRLVVMVTHNPELAEKYATRIVKLRDGKIISDSKPYNPRKAGEGVHRNLGKASMNFATALSLSFNNLRTKIARTILVSIAGSIGIIGIALILSLANGVNKYIDGIEEEALTQYPLMIEQNSFNMATMMQSDDIGKPVEGAEVTEGQLLTGVFGMIDSNDLKSLKKYIDSGKSGIEKESRAIQYNYNITPQIFLEDGGKYRQVNPDKTTDKMGFSYATGGLYASYMNSDSFLALPDDEEMYMSQYDVKEGRWPEKYNECVVVLSTDAVLADMTLYSLGLKDEKELNEYIEQFNEGKKVEIKDDPETFKYKDFMNVKLKVASSCELYERDATIGAWADKSGDDAFIQDLAARSDDLKIVGVVQPKEDVDFTILTPAVYYSNELQGHLMGISKESAIVKEQIADPKTNVLTGKPFGEEANAPELDNLFSVDENAISNAFGVNESAIENMIPGIAAEYQDDFAAIQAGMEQYLDSPEAEAIIKDAATEAMSGAAPTIPQDEMQALMDEIMNGYAEYAAAHGYTDPTRFNEYFAEYMSSPEVQAILTEKGGEMMGEMLAGAINSETSAAIANKLINGYAAYAAANGLPTMESLMGSMNLSGVDMSNLFYFDADAFANAFSINMDADSLSSMLTSFMAASQNTYDSNLRTFGYSDESNPYSIYIYPKDFESKGRIKDILTDYNDRMKEKGDDDKVIVYTDVVEALMSSVTNVINAISYILIAFVSISLIVSSIMIGVITYISVLERMKEIGILRAIGASKRNISEVFNAETVIIGTLAGVIGVGVSLLLLVPINMIIDAVTENITMRAALPPAAGILLVILSIILTLIGGLIPSRKAANSDPVTALRID